MKSMTGYGTAEGKVGKGHLFVEIKTVNHRFNELTIKIPNRMGALESHIRSHLADLFQRGKVDVFFKEKESLFGGVSVSLDLGLARRYLQALKKIRRDLHLPHGGDFLNIVGLDRMLKVEEKNGSYERLWGGIARLLNRAALQVDRMRRKEGLHILKDQKRRLHKLEGLTRRIAVIAKQSEGRNRERVRKRLGGSNTQTPADEQRLQMEVAMLGGRQDISEELLRLGSHVRQYAQILSLTEPVGRKLDFLLQEMNREANTIGAKAAHAKISQLVVNCKSELERLREQVQNIE